jgi:hypothetical protein
MQDKELREYIGVCGDDELYGSGDGEIQRLWNEINKLKSAAFVVDYFSNCPCCGGDDLILKSESCEFKKVEFSEFGNFVSTKHTTKKGAENHSLAIKKWEEEVKIFNKK